MQWDGATWVTAAPTPKAPLTGSGGGGDSTPTTPPVTGGSGSAWSMPKSTPHIVWSLPETVYAAGSAEYDATAFLEYDKAYNGVFLWNMGDGTTHRYTSPTTVVHTYQYPGTYIISFAYYKNPYDSKPFLFQSTEVSVGNPTVALTVAPGKGFQFTNTDTVPVDISGWIVVLSDTAITLPAFTIIAPKKTVLMPFSSFGIQSTYTTAQLQTPDRVSIGTSTKTKEVATPVLYRVAVPASSKVVNEGSVLGASAIDAVAVDEKKSTTKNPQKVGIVAIALCIVVGLFIAVEKIIASREE